jgi:NADH dehydrogenase
MAATEDKGLVTVFGGSGFLGRHVCRAFARRGWRVRAAVRRPDLAGHLQPMGTVGQVHAVQANLRYPESVERAVVGADAVVNCVAIGANVGAQTFESVNIEGARAVARAARAHNITRLVHVSALGANPEGAAKYAVSKAEGERATLEEVPTAIILRPSLIFGVEDQFFNRFAAMTRYSPVLPALGCGVTRFDPVFVGDVAAAVANAVEGHGRPSTIYELGGPETVTLKQIFERVATYTKRDVKPFPIPFPVAKVMAVLTWPLPTSVRPFTYDQVRMLQSDSIVTDAARREHRTLADLGVTQATAMEAVVPQYLEIYKPKGQFSHYRG